MVRVICGMTMKKSEKESFNYIFWETDEYPFVCYDKSTLTREEGGFISYFSPFHSLWINNPTYVANIEAGESTIKDINSILEIYRQKSSKLKEEYKIRIGFLLYSKLKYEKEKE